MLEKKKAKTRYFMAVTLHFLLDSFAVQARSTIKSCFTQVNVLQRTACKVLILNLSGNSLCFLQIFPKLSCSCFYIRFPQVTQQLIFSKQEHLCMIFLLKWSLSPLLYILRIQEQLFSRNNSQKDYQSCGQIYETSL